MAFYQMNSNAEWIMWRLLLRFIKQRKKSYAYLYAREKNGSIKLYYMMIHLLCALPTLMLNDALSHYKIYFRKAANRRILPISIRNRALHFCTVSPLFIFLCVSSSMVLVLTVYVSLCSLAFIENLCIFGWAWNIAGNVDNLCMLHSITF